MLESAPRTPETSTLLRNTHLHSPSPAHRLGRLVRKMTGWTQELIVTAAVSCQNPPAKQPINEQSGYCTAYPKRPSSSDSLEGSGQFHFSDFGFALQIIPLAKPPDMAKLRHCFKIEEAIMTKWATGVASDTSWNPFDRLQLPQHSFHGNHPVAFCNRGRPHTVSSVFCEAGLVETVEVHLWCRGFFNHRFSVPRWKSHDFAARCGKPSKKLSGRPKVNSTGEWIVCGAILW